MLSIIMFKNLGFERLRITSPRLYLTKVNNFFFKKRGGMTPSPPPYLGTVRARCGAKLNTPLLARCVPTYCGQAIKKNEKKSKLKLTICKISCIVYT